MLFRPYSIQINFWEYFDDVIKKLKLEPDVEVRARICNNINDLLKQPQYNLNPNQITYLEKYGNCNVYKVTEPKRQNTQTRRANQRRGLSPSSYGFLRGQPRTTSTGAPTV